MSKDSRDTPEQSLVPIADNVPVERYRTRWLNQAWDDFCAKLRQELTLSGATGVITVVITIILFIAGFAPLISLLPVWVFVAVLLGYFAYVLFRAPAKLDKDKQREVDGLNTKIEELNTSLESEIVKKKELKESCAAELSEWQRRAGNIEELTLVLGIFYLAYQQLEQGEILSEWTLESLSGRIGSALSRCFNNLEIQNDYYEGLPLVSDQKAWVDANCFKIRKLINEQRLKQPMLIKK